ncbi:DUF3817 domain-containing protein [Planctomicrobium sp. SH527]|uniref:DUF3817 domain-containing protein n=1 Tax=Planctomicrobium sp. SH527 TaxID=3448123 RepID=UPI003F5C085B
MLHPLSFLRGVGLLEGISFLLLLGVAMPAKYLAGYPQLVQIIGMAHGVLFVLYVIAVLIAAFARSWSIRRIAEELLGSMIPGGTFVLDVRWAREIREERSNDAAATTESAS